MNHSIRSIAYGNGIFIAVGGGGIIVSSTDNGVTWTARSSGTTDHLDGIAFGDGTFAALSYGYPQTDQILSSLDDGVTWTIHDGKSTYGLRSICYGNGSFVAVGNYGTILQSIILGDVNSDGIANIVDAISSLQIISGMSTAEQTITTDTGINADGKIGLTEVIFILQKIAGLR